MNDSLHPEIPSSTDTTLSTCLTQLSQENALLRQMVDGLTAFRTAALSCNLSTLSLSLQRHQGLQAIIQQVRQDREQMCRVLGIATLSDLITRLPTEEGQVLLEAREETRRLAEKTAELTQSTMTLARGCLGTIQRCLGDLGETAGEPRYGPSGARLEPRGKSLLQARG